MNSKNKFQLLKHCFITILLFCFCISINSCQSNSRSGRAKMIATAMAKKEANKKATTPIPETIKKDIEPQIIEIEEIVTVKEKIKIDKTLIKDEISPIKGKLIQVEGLVYKEVNKLTIDLKTSSSQVEQIFALKNHVFKNWHYLNDPSLYMDTWRSAEATISLKYRGIYSGDCDDFAILMASFARQIGLKSRVVGAFKNNGDGHAFAEFKVPEKDPNNPLLRGKDYRTDYQGKWISLDWFKGAEHREYKNDVQIIAQ